jgi:putative hydrolase of the HAD superfamily
MASMAAQGSPAPGQLPRAVLFDALGTLVGIEEPVSRLARELAERGAPVAEADAGRALFAEMTYYRAHCDEAVDERSLEALRDRCAEVLREALPAPARDLDGGSVRAALIAALRFTAFADAEPALAGLRAAGCSIAVVSNWDVSLHGVLRETGLVEHVDVVLTSAEEGVGKPGPEIFRRALERLGDVPAAHAMHVGDDVESDARGALAASISPVLVDRGGLVDVPAGVRVIASLTELLPGR